MCSPLCWDCFSVHTTMHLMQTPSGQCASNSHSPQSLSFWLCWEIWWPAHVCFFIFFFCFFCKSIHLLYVIGGCIWDKVDKRAWTHTFVSFTTVQRTWARDTSCCSPNRMFSSITNSYLSTLYSAAHTHTDKISFSWGSTPSTFKKKKKKLTRLDLLGSKLEQRIVGTVLSMHFWEGSSHSLSLWTSSSCSVLVNTNSLKCDYFILFGESLQSTFPLPLSPFVFIMLFIYEKSQPNWQLV